MAINYFSKKRLIYPLRFIKRLILTGSAHSRLYNEYIFSIAKQKPLLHEAVVNFTVDVELVDGQEKYSKIFRKNFDFLTTLADEYSLNLTWAVMGNILSTDFSFSYIVNRLRQMDNQEIASHSFSHIDYTSISLQVASNDIKKSIRSFAEMGEKPTTFIFPYNKVCHADIIKNAGFESYRGSHEQDIGKDENGLIVLPLGLCLNPDRFTVKEIILLIDEAIRKKAVIHLFTHLSDFQNEVELKYFFAPIFSYIKKCERNKQIITLTIKEIIKRLKGNRDE